jgi:hypothetical protein
MRGATDPVRNGLQRILVARDERQNGARVGELVRESFSDTTGCPGDQYPLALELHRRSICMTVLFGVESPLARSLLTNGT